MKLIKTEVLINRQIKVPVITGVYDPLSQKRDGTITSQAPIIVSGRNLDMMDEGSIRLCLASAVDCDNVIEVPHVYKYTHDQVIVSLPVLKPGEYFPAMKIVKKESEDSVYIFPISWVVVPEGYERRELYPCCTEIGK